MCHDNTDRVVCGQDLTDVQTTELSVCAWSTLKILSALVSLDLNPANVEADLLQQPNNWTLLLREANLFRAVAAEVDRAPKEQDRKLARTVADEVQYQLQWAQQQKIGGTDRRLLQKDAAGSWSWHTNTTSNPTRLRAIAEAGGLCLTSQDPPDTYQQEAADVPSSSPVLSTSPATPGQIRRGGPLPTLERRPPGDRNPLQSPESQNPRQSIARQDPELQKPERELLNSQFPYRTAEVVFSLENQAPTGSARQVGPVTHGQSQDCQEPPQPVGPTHTVHSRPQLAQEGQRRQEPLQPAHPQLHLTCPNRPHNQAPRPHTPWQDACPQPLYPELPVYPSGLQNPPRPPARWQDEYGQGPPQSAYPARLYDPLGHRAQGQEPPQPEYPGPHHAQGPHGLWQDQHQQLWPSIHPTATGLASRRPSAGRPPPPPRDRYQAHRQEPPQLEDPRLHHAQAWTPALPTATGLASRRPSAGRPPPQDRTTLEPWSVTGSSSKVPSAKRVDPIDDLVLLLHRSADLAATKPHRGSANQEEDLAGTLEQVEGLREGVRRSVWGWHSSSM